MSVLDRFRRRRPPPAAVEGLPCNELVELVTEYLEGTLTPEERARFDAHLDICSGCRTYLEQMRQTIEATGRLSDGAVPKEAMEALVQAFRSWNLG